MHRRIASVLIGAGLVAGALTAAAPAMAAPHTDPDRSACRQREDPRTELCEAVGVVEPPQGEGHEQLRDPGADQRAVQALARLGVLHALGRQVEDAQPSVAGEVPADGQL